MSPSDTPPYLEPGDKAKDKEPNMMVFRAEISALKVEREKALMEKAKFTEKQSAKGMSLTDIHILWEEQPGNPEVDMMELTLLDPEELTEEDALMWNKLKSHSSDLSTMLTEFEEYRKKVRSSGKNYSRTSFMAVLANKLQKMVGEEDMDTEIERRRI